MEPNTNWSNSYEVQPVPVLPKSETPETDEKVYMMDGIEAVVPASLARKLEKQRNQWRGVARQLHEQLGCKCGVNCSACESADDAFVALSVTPEERDQP